MLLPDVERTGMQNAHERFGTLEFVKRTKDTTTRVRVHIDRTVVEPAKNEQGQAVAHLISMIGGDSEIGALWAVVAEGALFQIRFPGYEAAITLGPEAQCFRGSVMVPGRKRPIRHLVAVSAELFKTKPGVDREGGRTILCDADPVFVLYRIAYRYGLPAVPEWAPWFMRELNQRKSITPLVGLGCSPLLVKGNKQTFMKWIGRALRERLIRIPEDNESIRWKFTPTFLAQSNLQQNESPQLTHDTIGRSG
jgi:hypothetical protein